MYLGRGNSPGINRGDSPMGFSFRGCPTRSARPEFLGVFWALASDLGVVLYVQRGQQIFLGIFGAKRRNLGGGYFRRGAPGKFWTPRPSAWGLGFGRKQEAANSAFSPAALTPQAQPLNPATSDHGPARARVGAQSCISVIRFNVCPVGHTT